MHLEMEKMDIMYCQREVNLAGTYNLEKLFILQFSPNAGRRANFFLKTIFLLHFKYTYEFFFTLLFPSDEINFHVERKGVKLYIEGRIYFATVWY